MSSKQQCGLDTIPIQFKMENILDAIQMILDLNSSKAERIYSMSYNLPLILLLLLLNETVKQNLKQLSIIG